MEIFGVEVSSARAEKELTYLGMVVRFVQKVPGHFCDCTM